MVQQTFFARKHLYRIKLDTVVGMTFSNGIAFVLFALGIIGTGMLAVPVLAGSAGYAVADALEWRSGFDREMTEAMGFFGVVAASTAIGTGIDFTSLDPIRAPVWSAVVNGVIAVPIMAVMIVAA